MDSKRQSKLPDGLGKKIIQALKTQNAPEGAPATPQGIPPESPQEPVMQHNIPVDEHGLDTISHMDFGSEEVQYEEVQGPPGYTEYQAPPQDELPSFETAGMPDEIPQYGSFMGAEEQTLPGSDLEEVAPNSYDQQSYEEFDYNQQTYQEFDYNQQSYDNQEENIDLSEDDIPQYQAPQLGQTPEPQYQQDYDTAQYQEYSPQSYEEPAIPQIEQPDDSQEQDITFHQYDEDYQQQSQIGYAHSDIMHDDLSQEQTWEDTGENIPQGLDLDAVQPVAGPEYSSSEPTTRSPLDLEGSPQTHYQPHNPQQPQTGPQYQQPGEPRRPVIQPDPLEEAPMPHTRFQEEPSYDLTADREHYYQQPPASYGRPEERYHHEPPVSYGRPEERYHHEPPASYGRPEERYHHEPPASYGRPEERYHHEPPVSYGRPDERYHHEPPVSYGRPDERYHHEPPVSYGRPEERYHHEPPVSYGRPDERYHHEPPVSYGRPDERYHHEPARDYSRPTERYYHEPARDYGRPAEKPRFEDERYRKEALREPSNNRPGADKPTTGPDIFNSNVETLIKLVGGLPAGVSRQTGAQIIKQTMEAMGISMSEVLADAQQALGRLHNFTKENYNIIEEHKILIRRLEDDIQYFHHKAKELDEIINLFVFSEHNQHGRHK